MSVDRTLVRQGIPERPHVLLDGAYGAANLGDNAIAYCMAQFLIRNGVDVTISSNYPEYTETAFGLKSTTALNFRRFKVGILRQVKNYDAVIIGGGQQLQEYRIPNPLIGMFARVCHMSRCARKHRVPFVAWSIGMDWPLSRLARFLARRYLGHRKATLIFRDGKSFERAKLLFKGRDCQIVESKDAAFMLPSFLGEPSADCCHEDSGANEKRLLICVSVLSSFPGALEKLVELCVDATHQGYEVWGWHSEIRENYDIKVRTMAAWDSIPGFKWLPPDPIDTNEVAKLIGSFSLVITTRMHPAIIAVSLGVASYGIATNEKMKVVFDDLTMPYSCAGEMDELVFSDIVGSDFSASFVMAAAFANDVERSGKHVLEAIHGGMISSKVE